MEYGTNGSQLVPRGRHRLVEGLGTCLHVSRRTLPHETQLSCMFLENLRGKIEIVGREGFLLHLTGLAIATEL